MRANYEIIHEQKRPESCYPGLDRANNNFKIEYKIGWTPRLAQ